MNAAFAQASSGWRDVVARADARFGPLNGWRGHLIALGGLALLLLGVFARDVTDLVTIWWTSSTFEHCLFVGPIIGWLVHQRARELIQLTPQPWALGLVWLSGGSVIWLVGDVASVAMLRHFGLVLMGQGAVAAILGPSIVRAIAFPLFFAFFLVPFGTDLEAPLQLLTAKLSMALLMLSGVPAHIDGIFITTPGGYFKVAEACSGTKFVIAMTAYGVLVCNVCFKSWKRRAIFLPSALAICVLANGVRAYGTIIASGYYGLDFAKGLDHVVYGWVFFGLVMALVMAAAWPFFDRDPSDPWFAPGVLQGEVERTQPLSLIAGAAALLMIVPPLWSAASVHDDVEIGRPIPPEVPGWEGSADPMTFPWKPSFPDADHLVQARYRTPGGLEVDLVIAAYAYQAEGHEIVGFGRGAVEPDSDWAWSSPASSPDGTKGEEITAPGPVVRHVATVYRVGSSLSGSEKQVKLATLIARLFGGDQRAAAIIVSAEEGQAVPADEIIATFLADMGNVKELADASVAIR